MSKAEMDCAIYAGVVCSKIREKGATVGNLERLADKILTTANPASSGLKNEVYTAIQKMQSKVELGEKPNRGDWTATSRKIDEWKDALRQRNSSRGMGQETSTETAPTGR